MTNMALYMKTRRHKRRLELIKVKGGMCQICQETNLLFLDLHHRERTQKQFGLSGAGLDKAWDKILEELEKCDLLCTGCHLKETRTQYQNGEIIQSNSKKHLPLIHGTTRCYQEMPCNCIECKLAKKQYRAKLISYDELTK